MVAGLKDTCSSDGQYLIDYITVSVFQITAHFVSLTFSYKKLQEILLLFFCIVIDQELSVLCNTDPDSQIFSSGYKLLLLVKFKYPYPLFSNERALSFRAYVFYSIVSKKVFFLQSVIFSAIFSTNSKYSTHFNLGCSVSCKKQLPCWFRSSQC